MGRRNETGIEIRGENSIRIRFMWNGVEQRETLKLPPTKQNIQYATRLRSEMLRKIEIGTFNFQEYFPRSKRNRVKKAEISLFKEKANAWLKTQESEKAHSTYITYKKYLEKYWLCEFGERSIDSILMSEITAHLATISVSPKTRNNILIPMRAILDIAYIDGDIKNNPTERIKNLKNQKPEPNPLTLGEVDMVIRSMLTNYDEQVANYFEFAFYTGLRTSELIELKWSDTEENQIIVRRAKVCGKTKPTKTYKTRVVQLNERARASLVRQAVHTKQNSEYVFNNPITNLPWNDQRAQSQLYWHPTLKRLGIYERDPYQTRHTFATMMLMMGANPMWVAKQMGHVNMKMLLEVYARWIDLADKTQEISRVNLKLIRPDFAQDK